MASNNDRYILDMDCWGKCSIYKLPLFVTMLKKEAYTPHAVSFGPYHYGKDNLKPMEQQKHLAVHLFLDRSRKSKEYYIESLREVAQDLKDSYNALDSPWDKDTDQFLELMLRDGCFMLEVLRITAPSFQNWSEYPTKHPIFSQHGKLHLIPFIRRDMLMLENQLPLLVLRKLTDTGNYKENNVIDLILDFCSRKSNDNCEYVHVLDVYRRSLLPESPPKTDSGQVYPDNIDSIIRCATEIHEAGVTFMRIGNGHLTDVLFTGFELKLPYFVVDDTTETIFLNLIAFERFHVGVGNEVTSYIFFMDSLIDSERDVAILHEYGIIQNLYGSDKAVAKLFNSLSKDTVLEPNGSLALVLKDVNAYCKRRSHVWRANLYRTYFRRPWALSFFAAIFLLALTIAQTVYTIKGFYKPS